MKTCCESCTLNDVDITDDQLAAGWYKLLLDQKKRQQLIRIDLADYDDLAAKQSPDPEVHKIATGRAIALCIERHSDVIPDCPLTDLSRYSNIDQPQLFA